VADWLAQVALIQLGIDDQQIEQMYGVQPQPLLLCEALGLDSSWYAVPSAQKKTGGAFRPLERGVPETCNQLTAIAAMIPMATVSIPVSCARTPVRLRSP